MPQTLALIHTSLIFVNTEPMIRDLIGEILPGVRLINVVDDALLADVMREKAIRPEVVRRMSLYVMAAEASGADAILSLCSSLGPAIDVARRLVSIPVIKIDDAHTAKAVRDGDRIGVMATVDTTLGPTVALIREKAAEQRKQVSIEESLSGEAFRALLAGDREKHDAMLLEAAVQLGPKVDVILLAQASMTRLASRIESTVQRPVVASPRLAIEHTRDVLASLRGS